VTEEHEDARTRWHSHLRPPRNFLRGLHAAGSWRANLADIANMSFVGRTMARIDGVISAMVVSAGANGGTSGTKAISTIQLHLFEQRRMPTACPGDKKLKMATF